MILPEPCVEIDTRRTPRCAILHGGPPTPTPMDPGGMMAVWCYGKSGGDAIARMQAFVAMMIKEKR